MGFHDAKLGHKLIEPIPIIALALAALVEILFQIPDDMIKDHNQAWQVAMHTVVVDVSA